MMDSDLFLFFFQAEDGIRDYKVTGVQTCALPISRSCRFGERGGKTQASREDCPLPYGGWMKLPSQARIEIGRASCRGRVEISVVAVSLKKKKKIRIVVD